MARVSSIRAAVAKHALLLRCRPKYVINEEVATVTHLNNALKPAAIVAVAEAYLPDDFTFVHCGVSTV